MVIANKRISKYSAKAVAYRWPRPLVSTKLHGCVVASGKNTTRGIPDAENRKAPSIAERSFFIQANGYQPVVREDYFFW
jgi:hypothetical protein